MEGAQLVGEVVVVGEQREVGEMVVLAGEQQGLKPLAEKEEDEEQLEVGEQLLGEPLVWLQLVEK